MKKTVIAWIFIVVLAGAVAAIESKPERFSVDMVDRIEWGHILFRVGKDVIDCKGQTERKYKQVEIGLRSDGVVVWRDQVK